ncbi:MAG: serine/threonine-protein phosphatase, partial [Firmicutes bacterium]|nr:serine/threonine-protein phosphatase [Bacillota bacterium]
RGITDSGEYSAMVQMLWNFLQNSDVYDIYYAMYDKDTGALVYIADPDPDAETACYPGDWEEVNRRELDKFLNWDGEGTLYDVSRTEKYGWMSTAGVPLRGEDGEIAGFILADITLGSVVSNARIFALQFGLSIAALTFVIAAISTGRIKKSVVKPINAIADAAQSYVNDRKAGNQFTDHFSKLDIKTGDEIENLSLVMADMERDIDIYTEDLTAVTAEKSRMGTELGMAAKIQSAMLPHIFPPYPDRKEFDLFALMDPAREVGGDFYDFFMTDENHLCLVIADVSGKGIPASLFMMASKVILQSYATLGLSADEILRKTNEALCKDNQLNMFVTCWLGILEVSTGKLTAVSAGHEYPAVKKPDGSFEIIKDPHGLALGCFDVSSYKSYELKLEPGSKIFVYTDGVAEAMNSENVQFGLDRTLDALNSAPMADPKTMIGNVRQSLADFVKEAEQFDDITMLCMEYRGAGPAGAQIPES